MYIIEDVNLNFIDELFDEIKGFNKETNTQSNMKKLVLPWPEKFSHPSTYIMNRFACLGSKAVKNISFGSKIAMLLFYFCFVINIPFLKNYAGKDTPVGKMLKFK